VTPGLDRAHLLDLEVANLLQQGLAAAEQDRGDVELELVPAPCTLRTAFRVGMHRERCGASTGR
jgi:hypothetical protein